MSAGSLGQLSLDLYANTGMMVAALRDTERHVSTLVWKMDQLGARIQQNFNKGAVAVNSASKSFFAAGAGAAAATAAINLISQATRSAVTSIFKLASSYEQAQVAMSTMLGSAKDANKLLGQLTTFAAETPFGFEELLGASRRLVGFGIAAEDVLPTLRRIGNVAAGIGAPISELAQVFGRNLVAGRMYLRDINEFQGRGIPILKALQEEYGRSREEILKMVSAGEVGSDDLIRAFERMGSAGGQFAGLMEAQSKTIGGLYTALVDNVQFSLRDIGQTVIEKFDIKDGLAGTIQAAKDYGQVVAVAIERVAAWGKAAWTVIGPAAKLAATFAAITLAGKSIVFIGAKIITTLQQIAKAQIMLNVLSGPKGWLQIAAGLVAVAAAADLTDKAFAEIAKTAREAAEAAEAIANGEPAKATAAVNLIGPAQERLRRFEAEYAAIDRQYTRAMNEGANQKVIDQLGKRIGELAEARNKFIEAAEKEANNPALQKLYATMQASRLSPDGIKALTAAQEDMSKAFWGTVFAEEARVRTINETVAAMEEEARTVRMTGDELELYRLRQERASEAQIEAARAAQLLRNENESFARAYQERNRLIEALEMEAETAGMTSREVQLLALSTQKASRAEMDYARQLIDRTDAAKRAQDQMDRLTGFADQVKESIKTPAEQLADAALKLQQAFLAGKLTADEFKRGWIDFKQQMDPIAEQSFGFSGLADAWRNIQTRSEDKNVDALDRAAEAALANAQAARNNAVSVDALTAAIGNGLSAVMWD